MSCNRQQKCVTVKYFSYFSTKTYVVCTQKKRLNEDNKVEIILDLLNHDISSLENSIDLYQQTPDLNSHGFSPSLLTHGIYLNFYPANLFCPERLGC